VGDRDRVTITVANQNRGRFASRQNIDAMDAGDRIDASWHLMIPYFVDDSLLNVYRASEHRCGRLMSCLRRQNARWPTISFDAAWRAIGRSVSSHVAQ
jgi:hypothetical protein